MGPTDNLLVLGRTEDMLSHLEIHLWNEDEGDSYVHHDLMLSSYPLCLEWLDFDCGEEEPGSFVAVGTMEPVIELWDLDVIDAPEPSFTLGTKSSKKRKQVRFGRRLRPRIPGGCPAVHRPPPERLCGSKAVSLR